MREKFTNSLFIRRVDNTDITLSSDNHNLKISLLPRIPLVHRHFYFVIREGQRRPPLKYTFANERPCKLLFPLTDIMQHFVLAAMLR